MVHTIARLCALLRDDDGQDLMEYVLLASLIAIVTVVAIGDVGLEVSRMWTTIAGGVPEAP